MNRIARHTVDMELVEEGVERQQETLERLLKVAATKPDALAIVESTARDYAGYLSAAEPKSEELVRALRIGAKAAAAMAALAIGSRTVEVDLGEVRATLPATGVTDLTHVANWRIGFWMAQIVRDRDAIDKLIAMPVDLMRRSSTRGDECQYLFAEALQAHERREPEWSGKLRAAVDATDPDALSLSDPEFVLEILVPEMQMLFRLATGEIAPFNEALQFALERHKKYWSKGNRKRDSGGYLALGPLALAGLGHEAGMPIEVTSDYLPMRLVEGGGR